MKWLLWQQQCMQESEMERWLTQQRKIRNRCAHIFTETCLHHNYSDRSRHNTGLQQNKRVGLCVYVIDAGCPARSISVTIKNENSVA